jgi:hypothetical protein
MGCVNRTKKITNDEIATMYEKKGGNVSATCTALGMDRKTFYNRKEKNKALRDKINETDESLIDFAESKLMEHINDGDVTSLIFFLKTKGKKRGYVERVENEISGNAFENLMKEVTGEDS